MSLLNEDGIPLDPLERAEAEMARKLNEALFGGGADWRVLELRRSVLGEAEAEPPSELVGLGAWLP